MTYKTILVQVDDTQACDDRIDYAAALAVEHEAHLSGLHLTSLLPVGMMMTPEIYGQQLREVRDKLEAEAREATDALRRRFEARVRQLGIDEPEWQHGEGDMARTAALHARYCDLFVVGQHNPEDSNSRDATDTNFAADVAIAGGRPSLVVPYVHGTVRSPRRILIAWNASREAIRAVTDALPLLRRAEQVHVLVVNPDHYPAMGGKEAGADIALYLSRHGIKTNVVHASAKGLGIGDLLLSRVSDLEADLMVTGAYGHSRLREMVLGGVTRALLQHMTVPVLMAH